MPISVRWMDDKKSILLMEYSGQWTWEELFDGIEQRDNLLASVSHQVGVISDLSEAHIKVPPNALTNIKNLSSRSNPDNVSIHVLVGMKPAHKVLWNIIEKLFSPLWKSQNFFMAGSITEAQEKIRQSEL